MNPQSSSLNYGVGLFETMRVNHGQIEGLKAHVNRLFTSIDRLNMVWDITEQALMEVIRSYVKENQLGSCALKIVVGEPDSLVITHRPNSYDANRYSEGFRLSISEVRRHSSNPLWAHKTTNYWTNTLVRSYLDHNEEAVFLNEDGALMEGTISNIFLIRGACVYTPALSCGLLAGIMRRQVLDWCIDKDIPVKEGVLYTEDLLSADGIFITNSLMGVMPIVECIGMPKDKHPLIEDLMEVYSGT